DAQEPGSSHPGQVMIPEQVEHLALLRRQTFHLLMELAPFRQPAWIMAVVHGLVGHVLTALGFRRAGMICADSLRSVVMTREINELPANHSGGQSKEIPW